MNAYMDTYELCLVLCGLDHNNDDDYDNEAKVNQMLYDKYSIEDTDGLEELIKDLTKLIGVGTSPLTGKKYKGFSIGDEWLYKIGI